MEEAEMKNKQSIWKAILLGLFACFLAIPVFGQQKKLEELSLEDLLNVPVVTASKVAERSSDAPGIIAVVSEKEIRSYGGFTLFDILDRVTSVYMHGSYARPHSEMSVRGDNSEFYNTRVLVLLDGRPIRESLQNGDNAAIYRSLPLETIQRIEIVRGPGSVLYGTTAYTGVINIISKQFESSRLNVAANAGTFGMGQGTIGAGTSIGDLKVNGAFNYLKSDGWSYTARGADQMIKRLNDSVAHTRPDWEESYGGSVRIGYRNFSVNSFYGVSDEMQMNRTNARWERFDKSKTEGPMFAGSKRASVDIGYAQELSNSWNVTANATYNYERFRDFTTKISSGAFVDMDRGSSNDWLLETSSYLKVSESINAVVGVLANMQSGQRTRLSSNSKDQDFPVRADTTDNPSQLVEVPQYDQTWYGGYAQVDYRPIQDLKLIAGGQINKATGIALDFVPRLGAIYSVSSRLTAKLLYGQAFRAPSAWERSKVTSWNVNGNNLVIKPGYASIPGSEKIGTLEAQLVYNAQSFEVAATYFNSSQINIIALTPASDSAYIIYFPTTPSSKKVGQMYVNSGTLDSYGFELEGKAFLSSELSVQGSATYQRSKDNKGREDYRGMPEFMLKLGIAYDAPFGLNVGLFNSYYGVAGNIVPDYPTANPEYKPFNFMTLNLGLNVTKILGVTSFPAICFNLYCQNLLDEAIYYKNYEARTINTIPGRGGRSLYGGLSVRL